MQNIRKGTEQTLRIIKKEFPKKNFKKCRSKVFDWKIPSEWNIFDAYILDKYGKNCRFQKIIYISKLFNTFNKK